MPPVNSLARSENEKTKGSHLPYYRTRTGERKDPVRVSFQVEFGSGQVDLVHSGSPEAKQKGTVTGLTSANNTVKGNFDQIEG